VVRGVWDGDDEAIFVGDEVETLQRKGMKLGQIAILVRAGFQTREFEERFIKLDVPYRVIGGPRFYERQEIRDAIAYMRVLHQPDDDLAFERIVNTPRRGIGDSTVRAIHSLARQQGVSMSEAAARLLETDELKAAARKALGVLLRDFERWRNLSAGMPQGELAEVVLDESGYTAMWQADKSPEAPGPPREPERADHGHGGVREPGRLPRACQPGHGERRGQSWRDGQHHDAAQRQGPGIRRRIPARLGGGPLSAPACAR
jgi:DNA helicase-2/ATP-dependent DNA helicase PcrA